MLFILGVDSDRAFCSFAFARKKTDVAERPEAFHHVGLLFNEPSAQADCSLDSHPKTSLQNQLAARGSLRRAAIYLSLIELYGIIDRTQCLTPLRWSLVR
jgi:hypothetical protein